MSLDISYEDVWKVANRLSPSEKANLIASLAASLATLPTQSAETPDRAMHNIWLTLREHGYEARDAQTVIADLEAERAAWE